MKIKFYQNDITTLITLTSAKAMNRLELQLKIWFVGHFKSLAPFTLTTLLAAKKYFHIPTGDVDIEYLYIHFLLFSVLFLNTAAIALSFLVTPIYFISFAIDLLQHDLGLIFLNVLL